MLPLKAEGLLELQPETHLPEGLFEVLGTCKNEHALVAHAEIKDQVWSKLKIVDVDYRPGKRLEGNVYLWMHLQGSFSVSSDRPEQDQVISQVESLCMGDGWILVKHGADAEKAKADEIMVIHVDPSGPSQLKIEGPKTLEQCKDQFKQNELLFRSVREVAW